MTAKSLTLYKPLRRPAPFGGMESTVTIDKDPVPKCNPTRSEPIAWLVIVDISGS